MKTLLTSRRGIFVVILAIGIYHFLAVRDTLAYTPHDVITAFEVSPVYQNDKTLFVIVNNHLQRSTDSGYSWTQLSRGLDNHHHLSSIAISPTFSSDNTLFLSSDGDGIYRSMDRGLSWHKVNMSPVHLKVRLLAISPAYSSDRILLASGADGGLYRTKDGGKIWHQVIGDNVKITAIAFSPVMDKKHIFIGDENGGVYTSTDSGDTWEQQFHLSNGDTITCIAISPNFSSDATIFIGTKQSGIIRKVAAGGHHIAVNNGLFELTAQPREYITSLAISPHYSRDSTIFASTWYTGIFRSDDGGKTWKTYSSGLTSNPQADTVRFKSPHFRELRISKTFPDDKTIFLAGYDGLFKSTDAGNFWVQLETISENIIVAISLSPQHKDDSTIAIATFLGGVYLSKDSGMTWQRMTRGLHGIRLNDITFSPNFPSDDPYLRFQTVPFTKALSSGKAGNKLNLATMGGEDHLALPWV